MPSIKLCHNANTFNYTLGAELGKGSFGTVSAVNETLNGQALVCKIINVSAPNPFSRFSRRESFESAIREINALKKLGLLAGYKYDDVNDQFTILMHHITGIRADVANSEKTTYAAFKALRALHHKGLVHLDAHLGNFIYNPTTEKATAIDFGMATEHSLCAEYCDYYSFLTDHNRRFFPKLTKYKLITFYISEMIDHAKNNKVKCAQNVFLIATITIAALTGTSVFGVAAILSKELIRRYILLEVSKTLNHCAKKTIHSRVTDKTLENNIGLKLFFLYNETLVTIMAGIILSADIASAYHHGEKVFSSLSHIYETLSPAATEFWIEAAKNVSAEDLGIALMGLMPLRAGFNMATAFVERNLLPECAVVAVTDFNHYTVGNAKNLFWNFGNKAAGAAQYAADRAKTAANTIAEYVRPAPMIV